MTLTYLNQKRSVVLDSTANGELSITVPNSQYWLPTLITVSIQARAFVRIDPTISMLFQLGVGSPNNYNIADLVDNTALGANDTTGAVAGLVIPPGIALNGQWVTSGPLASQIYAGGTAIMAVYGLAADAPPTLGIQPMIPGFRFNGASGSNTATAVPGQVGGGSALTVNIGDTSQLAASQIQHIDTGVLAPGGVFNILPSSGAGQYALHSMGLSLATAGTTNANLQQSNGTILDGLIWTQITAAGMLPPLGPRIYNGVPIPAGQGIQLANTSVMNQRFLGYLTYSFFPGF